VTLAKSVGGFAPFPALQRVDPVPPDHASTKESYGGRVRMG